MCYHITEILNYDLGQNSFLKRIIRNLKGEYRDDEMSEGDKKVVRKIYRRQFEKQVDFPGYTVTHSYYDSNVDFTKRLLIVGHRYVEIPSYVNPDGKKSILQKGKLPSAGIIYFDTGSVYGNKLTALIIENGNLDYLQV